MKSWKTGVLSMLMMVLVKRSQTRGSEAWPPGRGMPGLVSVMLPRRRQKAPFQPAGFP